MPTHRPHLRCAVIVLAWSALLLSARLASANDVGPGQRPTPKEWEQWQPQKDASDLRLQASVLLWEPQLTVRQALEQLSEQSGAPLSSTPDLSESEISVFSRQHSLRALMIGLADLFSGYWVYPRGQAPSDRGYCLVSRIPPPESVEGWRDGQRERVSRQTSAAVRALREKQLQKYTSALSLSPADVLRRYERTDPWLCVHVLHPAHQPIVEQVATLSETDLEQLLSTSELTRPLRTFSAEFQHHVALWVKGTWGPTGRTEVIPDPDALPRFATPEEAWANSIVRLWWYEGGLRFSLHLPDGNAFRADVIGREGVGPYDPRMTLAALGYRDATPDYVKAARAEMKTWTRPPDCPSAVSLDNLHLPLRSPEPDQNDPCLKREMRLDALDQHGTLAAAAVLEQMALQCEVEALSIYLPPDWCAIPWPKDGNCITLGAALNAIRAARGGAWSWGIRASMLVGPDVDHWAIPRCRVPDAVIAECSEMLRPPGAVEVSKLAWLVARLNEVQAARLADAFPILGEYSLAGLRLYGSLTPTQRADLSSESGLSFSRLTPEQQWVAWRGIKRTHPWLGPSDVGAAVLRVIGRRLSTGDPGLSLVIEYNVSDSPSDRDVVLTCPWTVRIPPRPRQTWMAPYEDR